MTNQLTAQSGGDPDAWYDDPDILDEDRLIRAVRTHQQIVRNGDGTYGVSDQLWTSQGGGCSVELASLLAAANVTPEERAAGRLGASEVGVGDVRATMARFDQAKKQPVDPLGVAYTPIGKDEPFGPNPYHCDIFPKLGKPGSRDLHGKARPLFLDQALAAEAWAQRHGIAKA